MFQTEGDFRSAMLGSADEAQFRRFMSGLPTRMACVFMACVGMAYIVMAYIVMVLYSWPR